MHYYKFNISDWALHTAHLSLVEEAIYFRLINFYYDSEKPIPIDLTPIVRKLRMREESQTVCDILGEFFCETEKGFIHNRCEQLLKEYRKTNKKNKANGSKGGRPSNSKASKETQKEPTGLIVETQAEPTDNPNYELLTNNQELITINQSTKDLDQSEIDQKVLEFCFNQFWESGIRKVNKKKAKPLFISILKKNSEPSGQKAYNFSAKIEHDIKARLNINQMGFAEMHPTTYLNGERWTDEIKEVNNGQHQQPNQQYICNNEQQLRQAADHSAKLQQEIADIEAEQAQGEHYDQPMGFIER